MSKQSFIVAGLGFGDEGKGTTVDALTKKFNAELVVRYNGGAQAAHNVIIDNGIHHTFAQFGSGTFHGAKTLLSKYVYVNPYSMLIEAKLLSDKGVNNPLNIVFVDENCLVTTIYHIYANRIKEFLRGGGKHGSCGMGIFETVNCPEKIYVKDIQNSDILIHKLSNIRKYYKELFIQQNFKNIKQIQSVYLTYTKMIHSDKVDDLNFIAVNFKKWYDQINILKSNELFTFIDNTQTVIFEGAQGILLDQDSKFFPNVTPSKTTTANAEEILKNCVLRDTKKIGVIRTYQTRHGAGPLPTETKSINFGYEEHNFSHPYQDNFRVGYLDLTLIRYAIDQNKGVDLLSITHTDKFPKGVVDVVVNYGSVSNLTYEEISNCLEIPISILSFGPKTNEKKFLTI